MDIVKRKIGKKFDKLSQAYKILALVGPRQSGKTTFIKKHIEEINGNYFSFDDPDVRNLFSKEIKKFEIQFINPKKVTALDEVNYAENAGINLKYLADKDNRLWLSSSSELILSEKVLSHLVGRVSILRLFPFNIMEFLEAKKQKVLNEEILERIVWEHMTYGGYPKAVLTEDNELKKIILRDLYQTMILKDISNTFSISDVSSLELFTKYLAINNGKVLSYDSISKNLNISFQSVKKYLDAMKKSYLIYEVTPFHTNKLKEIVKQPKFYFVDTGMRNVISNSFDLLPTGEIFENYVLTEIIKKSFDLKYWRTKSGAEVDFVLEKEKEIIPIEVKIKSLRRVGQGMKSFIELYKPKRAFVVSYSKDSKKEVIEFKECKVHFLDVYDLLQELE